MLERLLKFSIQNRWLVVLFALGVGGVGIYSLLRLPIDAVPDITNNQVQINTSVASLSPQEIEKRVTLPIETALAGIPGLQGSRSISRNGFSQVTAVFEDDVDIYFARNQITERLREAKETLPTGAEPMMGPIATGLGEVYMWTVAYEHPLGRESKPVDGEPGWQSDGRYLTPEGQELKTDVERAAYLRTVQDWIIRPQLKGVKGLAGVDSIGGYVKQFHVQPDPMKLISYGLTFRDVIEALEKNNSSIGAGYIEHKGESYIVRTAGQINTIDEIPRIRVAFRNGTPIHISDVATVLVGRELRTGSASENGEEVVVGTAIMLIGANSRIVAKAVDDQMLKVNQGLPPNIRAKTVLNRMKLVDATVGTVEKNLGEGAILVVVVLFLLLGNLRAALITALAIPLAMLVTATGMVQMKISGNLMSLGAIDFGLIVDGAVIIVENCLRMLAEKQHQLGRTLTSAERQEAVLTASRQMIKPSVFGQAIIITVYLPILFLTGVEGKMFRPMAATVIFALVGAFVLSMTLIPALIALLIRGKVKEKENLLIRAVKRIYEPTVEWAIRLRWAVVPLAVLLFAFSIFLFTRLGREFVPTLDEKDIALNVMRIPSTSLTQSQHMQFDVERAISAMPEVAFVFSKTGTAEMASDPMPANLSDTFIIVKPEADWRSETELDQRIAAQEEAMKKIAPDEKTKPEAKEEEGLKFTGRKAKLMRLIELTVKQLPGNNYEFTQPIQMRFNELIAGVRGDVAVKVYGDNVEQMQKTARQVAAILQSVPGATEVKVDQTEGLPVLNIDVDRTAAYAFGLNIADVQEVIAVAVGGREAGQVFEGDRRYNIVVRLPDDVRRNVASLEALPIPIPRADGGGRDAEKPARTVLLGTENASSDLPGFVPLGSILVDHEIKMIEGPNQISRENGKRVIAVQTNVRGRDLGSFVVEAQKKVEGQIKRPAGIFPFGWGGQFENLEAAQKRLTLVVPICFLLIFLLLFSTFNSVKYAMMVFSGVPLALTGGIIALWLRDMSFSISAAVGFIALSGVAVLNGLVMVTFINELRRDGMGLEAAIRQGSLTRLRPVLMTALVASLGFIPMALAHGTGAEVQKPLATVVIGGIISSTFLTLVVLPALYRLWHSRENYPAE